MLSDDALKILSERLPELSWQMRSLTDAQLRRQVPKGLFQIKTGITVKSCMDSIKHDLDWLICQQDSVRARYVALLVHRKINALVLICQRKRRQEQTKGSPNQRIEPYAALQSRQKWYNQLEQDIAELKLQRQALLSVLEDKKTTQPDLILQIEAHLGDLNQQLTILEEQL